MKNIYLLGIVLFTALPAFSQYTQNFSTLTNTGSELSNILPEGWGLYEIGTGGAADGRYAVGTGSSNTGNAYSFGIANGNPERSLGTVASGSNFPTIGVIFFNEADTAVTSITISYTGEQWRFGGRSDASKDTLRFEYSLDASGIVNNVGTWFRVNQLDFLSPTASTPTNAATLLDGNAPANRQGITYTITGLNLQPGESIVFRWTDYNIIGNDDGLAIDDFSISEGLIPGTMTSGGTSTGGGTGSGGYVAVAESTSVPMFEHKVSADSSYLHLFGNLHAHSTHSDGKTSSREPVNDYEYARTAQGMDFLGISEHNHSTAGLLIADYKRGSIQADTSNGKPNIAGQPFVALHGMEWGVISGGGHVLVYGFKDSLIGWEPGNYDIFVQKSDYITLFDKIRNNPGAVALLAHPNSSDYTNLPGGYKGVADSAIASVAIESGPAFSTSTNYAHYPAGLAYIGYYRNMLKQGYRLGAHMDQDNHEMTYGTANGNRIVVLSKDRSREGILNAIKNMRVYASNDYNARVSFTMDNFVIGSSIITDKNVTAVITHDDGNGEGLSAIQVYGAMVRGGDASLIHSATTNTTFNTSQAVGETWYYYAIVTQADGNRIITAPIWVTRTAAAFPIKLTDFNATVQNNSSVLLNWNSVTEINSDHFIVERSADLLTFNSIGRVNAKGTAAAYSLVDNNPLQGKSYYRLRQVDKDGQVEHSKIVTANLRKEYVVSLTPNPSRGVVKIINNLPASQRVLVQVIDIAGQLVYNQTHNGSNQININLQHLADGFYVVRVGDELRKLVISK